MTRVQKRIRTVAILSAIIGIAMLLCGHGTKQSPEIWEIYTVEQGETLWSISKQYAPKNSDIRDYIYLLQKKNGIGADLQAGQTIEILKEE